MENLELNQNNQSDTQNDNVATQEQKHLKLSDYLKSNEIETRKDEQGRIVAFVPKNEQRKEKQLDVLVNCIDDYCEKTNELISLALIDTREVKTMKYLFRDSPRKNYKGIEKWDTSKVTCFEGMFAGTDFDEDISGWDVSNARTFEAMFAYTSKFNRPIGAHWDTQNATNMIRMFRFAKEFNNGGQPFGEKWKMDKVEWTWEMFWGAEKFNAPRLNEWNMSKVTKCYTMFNGAKAFNQPLDRWDLSNAVNLGSMFNKAESFNQDLSAWGERLGKAQDMHRMFADTKSLEIDFLSKWKVSENCNTDNITKGNPFLPNPQITYISEDGAEQETDATASQSTEQTLPTQEQKKQKITREISEFRIYKIAQIPSVLSKLKMKDLYGWIPKNIKENYEIFLAKKSENDVVAGDESEWDFIFYSVFGECFVVETDDKKFTQNNRELLSIEQIKYDDEDDESFDFSEVKIDYENGALKVSLEDNDKKMHIFNGNTNTDSKSNCRVLNIIGALILAKAYEAKIEHFNERARERKIKLTQCHKEICEFDLYFYQNTPVEHNLQLIEFWEKISTRYRVASKHSELKETIAQVAKLVSERNQAKISRLISFVAILVSLFVGIFAPMIREWLFK